MVNDKLSALDRRKKQNLQTPSKELKPQAQNFNVAAPSVQPKGNIEMGCRGDNNTAGVDFEVHLWYSTFIESAFMWS